MLEFDLVLFLVQELLIDELFVNFGGCSMTFSKEEVFTAIWNNDIEVLDYYNNWKEPVEVDSEQLGIRVTVNR